MHCDKVFVVLSLSSIVINMAIALAGPLLAPEGKRKGIDTKLIGYLFA